MVYLTLELYSKLAKIEFTISITIKLVPKTQPTVAKEIQITSVVLKRWGVVEIRKYYPKRQRISQLTYAGLLWLG